MIKNEDLRRYSAEVLRLFEREDIKDVEGLQKRLGESFVAEKGSIKLEARPGGLKLIPIGVVLTISYKAKREGIPIEIRLNIKGDYSSMIIKSRWPKENYVLLGRDSFGNLIQNKRFYGCSIPRLKQELEFLAVK